MTLSKLNTLITATIMFVLLLFLHTSPHAQTTVDVDIVDFDFSPANLTIDSGTTVRWVNLGAVTHTTTSTDNIWDSGNMAPDDAFSFTFDTVGTFDYLCTLHPSLMTGTITVQPVTDVHDEYTRLPDGFELRANYPNPFNPSTTIEYVLPERTHVNVSVYNLLGQPVNILMDKEQAAGEHAVIWDGTDENGTAAPSGLYFYRIKSDKHSITRKMVLLK